MSRLRIKFCGESGQGIDSIGQIVAKALADGGYKTFGYREYPSLIKGGYASYQIDISDHIIKSASKEVDILVGLSRYSLYQYVTTVASGGLVIHCIDQLELPEDIADYAHENKIQICYVDAVALAESTGGSKMMANMILIGITWKLLGINAQHIQKIVKQNFEHKSAKIIDANLKCLDLAAQYQLPATNSDNFKINFSQDKKWTDSIVVDGNWGIAKGTVAAGVKAFYAYPMTPSSSILTYLADWQAETKMLVKQIEDEISAAQFTIGSSFMGMRAMTATSGGGFDLMTESLSMAGITETPFVVVLAQRPGPGTGQPTWTMAADLNLAVYGGHGEFARVVLSVFDPNSSYEIIQQAHNLSEKFRIPVVVLTDKQIAESIFNISGLGQPLPIDRGVLADKASAAEEFYGVASDDSISKRWLPGTENPVYLANSDEHTNRGDSTEDAEIAKMQYAKRNQKVQKILADFPAPFAYGNEASQKVIIGWGSTENAFHDVLEGSDRDICYLHFTHLWPLDAEAIKKLLAGKKLFAVENNYTAQFAKLLQAEVGVSFEKIFTKYDGRGFYLEDIEKIVQEVEKI